VDLNIIVDYAWPRFLAHVSEFVHALVDDQAVCDLLAALRPDSVAAPGGSYASALPRPGPSTVCPLSSAHFTGYHGVKRLAVQVTVSLRPVYPTYPKMQEKVGATVWKVMSILVMSRRWHSQ
jgi:hypothetical protein